MSNTQLRNTACFTKIQVGGKGLQVKKTSPMGKGMQFNPAWLKRPPHYIGTWGEKNEVS